MMQRFWLSWTCHSSVPFILDWPWWISGHTYDKQDNQVGIFCAAVVAEDEDAALAAVRKAYGRHRPPSFRWRFVLRQQDDWSPFCERFQRSDWMQWPSAPAATEEASASSSQGTGSSSRME